MHLWHLYVLFICLFTTGLKIKNPTKTKSLSQGISCYLFGLIHLQLFLCKKTLCQTTTVPLFLTSNVIYSEILSLSLLIDSFLGLY